MEDHVNLAVPELIERAVSAGEGILTDRGALAVFTGSRTGRSARDKRIVRNAATEGVVAWGDVNRPVDQNVFDALFNKVEAYLQARETFSFEGYAGVRPQHARDFRVVCELPSQAFFISQLLHRSSEVAGDPFLILVAPGFACNPDEDGTQSDAAIMIDHASRRALIVGTRYSGEIKKCVFSIMNFELPQEGVLPMHCSANQAFDGSTAVFFGLSGTGKTTLSADPARVLIGDDEHGWADDGVFNFEAGCYAKCIDLDPAREPDIHQAIRFGSLIENVVIDEATRVPLFSDGSITENTRAAYPLTHIARTEPSGRGQVPSTVIFLTADAFGVLPPIARLDLPQAMYWFLSGYTSKVAGTEVGVTDPEPTFSTCFGEPFLPLPPETYARMLEEKMRTSGAEAYLVNTGWNGRGERMPLSCTRAMVDAALSGALAKEPCVADPVFGFQVPKNCPGVASELLDPRASWAEADAYDAQARKLANMLQENFQEKHGHASEDIRQAGPRIA